MKQNRESVIALLGQPNSGKSTLFNGLTGMRQHVGNWPGKTVEKKEGYFTYDGLQYTVVDLPGSYSLSANSEEEVITREYIASGKADAVCILADASQLGRSLFMLADYAGIQIPAFLVLNMIDIAEEQGKTIDVKELEKRLGIPVLPFSATDKKGYGRFYQVLKKVLKDRTLVNTEELKDQFGQIEKFKDIYEILPKEEKLYSAVWTEIGRASCRERV